MAIETHCPQGHRIRVQDDRAGRTGRCPTCGTTFRIEAAPELPVARLVPLDPAVVATLPRARPLGAAAKPADAQEQAIAAPPDAARDEKRFRAEPAPPATAPPATAPPATAPPATAPPATALHTLIAERPDLTWCIAFPGGDPTEPIDAATMQAWLDAGHATGTEVVWRADWPEWRPVREVFPRFFAENDGL